MLALEGVLARIARDLDALGHPWALVGALAVAAYAEARSTLDVDVVVAVDGPADSALLVKALRERGYRWQADFGSAMTTLATTADDSAVEIRLDLLFSMAGIEAEVARGARPLAVVAGLAVPVARCGDLIALKLLAAGEPGREHDWRDLRALLGAASGDDLEDARRAIALMVARGAAAPGRLEEALLRLEREASPGRG
jgi:hypothetical protein